MRIRKPNLKNQKKLSRSSVIRLSAKRMTSLAMPGSISLSAAVVPVVARALAIFLTPYSEIYSETVARAAAAIERTVVAIYAMT